MAQARVDTYNQSQGEDDGTGIQCPDCNNRAAVAFLNDDGLFRAKYQPIGIDAEGLCNN